jgi:transketolase
LKKQNIFITVVDLYSVKPVDSKTINDLAQKTKNIIVVEDHYPYGGLGEAVMQALLENSKSEILNSKLIHLCVRKIPMSGKPAELLRYEEIDANAIMKAVKEM